MKYQKRNVQSTEIDINLILLSQFMKELYILVVKIYVIGDF